jgi:four helix bundle protein
MEEREPVVKKGREFALRVVGVYRDLRERRMSPVLANEALRAGTGIGMNLAEAEADQKGIYFGELRRGALRGCHETRHWIDLLHETGCIPDALHTGLIADCEELLGMLTAEEERAIPEPEA